MDYRRYAFSNSRSCASQTEGCTFSRLPFTCLNYSPRAANQPGGPKLNVNGHDYTERHVLALFWNGMYGTDRFRLNRAHWVLDIFRVTCQENETLHRSNVREWGGRWWISYNVFTTALTLLTLKCSTTQWDGDESQTMLGRKAPNTYSRGPRVWSCKTERWTF